MKEKGERIAPPKVEFKALYNGENEHLCPGYRSVDYKRGTTPYSAIVRCTASHGHRVKLKLLDGIAHEIPLYHWICELQSEEQLRQRVAGDERRDGYRNKRAEESVAVARGLEPVSGMLLPPTSGEDVPF